VSGTKTRLPPASLALASGVDSGSCEPVSQSPGLADRPRALAAGIYLIAKAGSNFGDIANHLARRIELDPQRSWIRHLIAKLGRLRKHEVTVFGAGAIAYGVLELVEGGGLFYRKRWAEWLTVIATSLLVPLEVYELVRHPSWLKAGGVAVNVAIVIYLYRVVRQRAR
jgi:uncharacterized membrane protein (DUF2068 family)